MTLDPIYDVFLSHTSRDKPQVEELARRLKRRRLKPFLDKWHLVPGEPWQEALEEALDRSRTFAVFLGPGDLGPWQNEELRDALDTRVQDKSRRVIPVLLPGASMPEKQALPRFLRRLTWVDFRGGLDDPQALHRLVCGIKGIPPEGGPVPASPPARPTMIGVPHRNPYFTGREELLSCLHQQLQTQGISALAQAAIHGLGGIGKTQAAIQYAHRFGEHYRFVLWAVAEEETVLRLAYLSIARELGIVDTQADIETAVLAVKAWLSHEDGWLLVFDNADDPALVRPYLPLARTRGKVLLTSRAKSFTNVGVREPFRVETLDPGDAVKFLVERTGNADIQEAAALAAELGFLPLALEQAAAYIETVGGGFAGYLARYRHQGVALFAKSKPSTDYPKTVATTWTLSFDAVREASPASAELLISVAFLVPDSVPIEIFTLGGSKFGGLLAQGLKGADEDTLIFWELLEPLERYSLVERLPDDAFKLHRLTQEVVQDSLGEEGRRAWAERVVRALDAAYPGVKFENWKLCERLQPNARSASELTRTYKLESAEAARLFNQAGQFAGTQGEHASAKLFTELSLEIFERVLGGEHSKTLTAMNNLAGTLFDLGDLPGTRKLLQRILEVCDRVLGGEHPDTLQSKSNMAATLQALGNLDGARSLQEQILEIQERVLGDEHLGTLESKNNLAMTLQAMGDLVGARKLQEQTLEVFERVLGDEHPDTLTVMNNLAMILNFLGDLAGARSLQEQTLEIQERVLGGEHPDTLKAMNNLAATLAALSDLADARKHFEHTLEIQERVLGGEHPDTTMSTWNLFQTVLKLDDPDAEANLIDRLRWLLDRDENLIPSADQRTIRRWLLELLALS